MVNFLEPAPVKVLFSTKKTKFVVTVVKYPQNRIAKLQTLSTINFASQLHEECQA